MDRRNVFGRCPYCNKKLGKLTVQYANKHIIRCKNRLNPYQYTDRHVGRPTNKEKREELMNRKNREED